MLSKLKALIAQNKYAAIGVSAVLVLTAAVIIILSLSYQNNRMLSSAPPTPTEPAATPADTEAPEPSATAPASGEPAPTPAQTTGPNGSFSLAICPAGVTLEPTTTTASGFTPAPNPPLNPLSDIQWISAGHVFDEAGYGSQFGSSFALAKDGTLYQWGMINWDAKNRPSAFPQKVTGIDGKIKQIDGRFVLTEQGDVYLLYSDKAPQQIKELAGSVSIAQAREAEVYAVDSEGIVRYYTLYGQQDGKPSFTKLAALGKVKSITASPFIMLAITQDDKLLRLDLYGAPGAKPVEVTVTGESVLYVYPTMSYKYLAFIKTDKGHWFTITNEQKLEAVKVPDNTIQIAAMEHDAVALKADGTVWAWGEGGGYVLPQGSMLAPEQARQVKGLTGVKALAAGQSHLLALTEGGRVLSAGSNMYGQLGQLPIYAEQPTAIGSWSGADALFAIYNELFAVRNGDVWSLDVANQRAKPVLLGQHAKKALMALGHYAILTEDGKLIIADPDVTQPCRILQAQSPIVDAAQTNGGLVLALQDGRVVLAEGNMRQIVMKSELRMDPKPAGKVTQVFSDPIPFVLTDQGELYFHQQTQGGVPILRPVISETPIKQWSTLHYDFFEGKGFVGKAIGANNRVYDVQVTLQGDSNPDNRTASVQLARTPQSGATLSGSAVIEENGRITETLFSTTTDTMLPAGAKLQAEASFYHLPIEGRTYFYHAFLTDDGTIYWLGDRPYVGPDMPKPVLAPQ